MAEVKKIDGTARTPKMHWYVVHTLTGQEVQAKKQLEERIVASGMSEMFGKEIKIPMVKSIEIVNGRKKERTDKSFPGYILVELLMTEETWHLVRETPRITGFVGGGNQPNNLNSIPFLPMREVKKLTDDSQESETVRPKIEFNLGEKVRIISGAFTNFEGSVQHVDNNKFKLKVNVEMFGRTTPVEVDFSQAEKVS